jgi:hypothetical protein
VALWRKSARCSELDNELQGKIPWGYGVALILKWPFANKRTVKPILKREILKLLTNGASTHNVTIEGNEIQIKIRFHGDGPGSVYAVGEPFALPPDDQTIAWCALEERIKAKEEKCRPLKFNGPVWLALFDIYRLADVETHRRAMGKFSVNHPFDKILLVSGDGSVDELFGRYS